MSIKRACLIAMMLAMAIVLNIIEGFIPMFIPGVKLGLANCIILIMLYQMKWYEALLVMILRILLVGLFRGNIFTLTWLMSLSGGVCSFIVMLIFSKINFFSPIGTSVLGSISHCFGQIVVAMLMLSASSFIYYLPFIALLSVLTGVINGMICRLLNKRKIVETILNR